MQRIAVAYDGSPESATALMAAFGLAERTHATVLLIAVAEVIRWGYGEAQSVVTDEEYMSHERRSLEELIGDAIANAPQGVRVEGAVLAGPIAETVASAAGDVDLLLAGSRGYGPVRRVLLGSTTAKLMGISPAPILILPRSAGNDPLVEWHEEPMALDPYSPLP
jgi:nucleotide-binding universal stress UspA family protein